MNSKQDMNGNPEESSSAQTEYRRMVESNDIRVVIDQITDPTVSAVRMLMLMDRQDPLAHLPVYARKSYLLRHCWHYLWNTKHEDDEKVVRALNERKDNEMEKLHNPIRKMLERIHLDGVTGDSLLTDSVMEFRSWSTEKYDKYQHDYYYVPFAVYFKEVDIRICKARVLLDEYIDAQQDREISRNEIVERINVIISQVNVLPVSADITELMGPTELYDSERDVLQRRKQDAEHAEKVNKRYVRRHERMVADSEVRSDADVDRYQEGQSWEPVLPILIRSDIQPCADETGGWEEDRAFWEKKRNEVRVRFSEFMTLIGLQQDAGNLPRDFMVPHAIYFEPLFLQAIERIKTLKEEYDRERSADLEPEILMTLRMQTLRQEASEKAVAMRLERYATGYDESLGNTAVVLPTMLEPADLRARFYRFVCGKENEVFLQMQIHYERSMNAMVLSRIATLPSVEPSPENAPSDQSQSPHSSSPLRTPDDHCIVSLPQHCEGRSYTVVLAHLLNFCMDHQDVPAVQRVLRAFAKDVHRVMMESASFYTENEKANQVARRLCVLLRLSLKAGILMEPVAEIEGY